MTYTALPRDVQRILDNTYEYQYCADCNGIIVDSRREAHNNFHATFTNRKDGNMSSVLWCDPGDHAFKSNAPGSVHFEGEERDENGTLVSTSIDACVLHRPDRKPNPNSDAVRQALTIEAANELRDTQVHPYL